MPMRHPLKSALLLLSALIHVPLAAQGAPGWTQVGTTGPSARAYHAVAHDSQRGKTVLFGGNNHSLGTFGDTWEWNGSSWVQVPTTGPGARAGHAMVYDSMRGRTVLFGGYGLGGILRDTWEWNGTSWALVATTGPTARYYHAMAYDSVRGKTVLFGGWDNSRFGDTWEWDGSSWVQVATTGPAARAYSAMAYDSMRGRTVLFGGQGDNVANFGDTWEWNGSAWLPQVFASGPAARHVHAMAYDSQRGRTVVFGGYIGNGINFGDTWEWNGSAWLPLIFASGPTARYAHAMAYDNARRRTMMFGGYAGSAHVGDHWELGGPIATATPFGSGCGNPPLAISPVSSAAPRIGDTAQASLSNIPSAVAFVSLGLSRFLFPPSLASYSGPGCDLWQSANAPAEPVALVGPGAGTFSLAIPSWTSLIGMHLYLQGWAPAPGMNAGNLIVSNGLDWLIGY